MVLMMMSEAPAGVIAGGWSYVVAAYGLTFVVFAGFLWSLLSRSRKEG